MVGRQFRTSLHIEMVSTDLFPVFLPIFIIYLTVKWFLTYFEFFFLMKKSLSLSRLHSYKMEALLVLSRPD